MLVSFERFWSSTKNCQRREGCREWESKKWLRVFLLHELLNSTGRTLPRLCRLDVVCCLLSFSMKECANSRTSFGSELHVSPSALLLSTLLDLLRTSKHAVSAASVSNWWCQIEKAAWTLIQLQQHNHGTAAIGSSEQRWECMFFISI